MTIKKPCPNFNHSRTYISISFCPQCGDKFNTQFKSSCNEDTHRLRRKDRHVFCIDCGKNLKIDNSKTSSF